MFFRCEMGMTDITCNKMMNFFGNFKSLRRQRVFLRMFVRDGTETPRRQWSIRTNLLEPAVLLHQRRKHAGAAAWRGLHIVVTEAAEEGAEDATAPLLLQANVALGGWGEKQ